MWEINLLMPGRHGSPSSARPTTSEFFRVVQSTRSFWRHALRATGPIITLLVTLGRLGGSEAAALTNEQIRSRLSASIFQIVTVPNEYNAATNTHKCNKGQTPTTWGTGYLIGQAGKPQTHRVLTAAHVFEENNITSLVSKNGTYCILAVWKDKKGEQSDVRLYLKDLVTKNDYKTKNQPDIAILHLNNWQANHRKAGPPIKLRFADMIENSSQSMPVVGLGYSEIRNKTPFFNPPIMDVFPLTWSGDECSKTEKSCTFISPAIPRGVSGGPVVIFEEDGQPYVAATVTDDNQAQSIFRIERFLQVNLTDPSVYVLGSNETSADDPWNDVTLLPSGQSKKSGDRIEMTVLLVAGLDDPTRLVNVGSDSRDFCDLKWRLDTQPLEHSAAPPLRRVSLTPEQARLDAVGTFRKILVERYGVSQTHEVRVICRFVTRQGNASSAKDKTVSDNFLGGTVTRELSHYFRLNPALSEEFLHVQNGYPPTTGYLLLVELDVPLEGKGSSILRWRLYDLAREKEVDWKIDEDAGDTYARLLEKMHAYVELLPIIRSDHNGESSSYDGFVETYSTLSPREREARLIQLLTRIVGAGFKNAFPKRVLLASCFHFAQRAIQNYVKIHDDAQETNKNQVLSQLDNLIYEFESKFIGIPSQIKKLVNRRFPFFQRFHEIDALPQDQWADNCFNADDLMTAQSKEGHFARRRERHNITAKEIYGDRLQFFLYGEFDRAWQYQGTASPRVKLDVYLSQPKASRDAGRPSGKGATSFTTLSVPSSSDGRRIAEAVIVDVLCHWPDAMDEAGIESSMLEHYLTQELGAEVMKSLLSSCENLATF